MSPQTASQDGHGNPVIDQLNSFIASADGVLLAPNGRDNLVEGVAHITKGSIAAITLNPPVAGVDDEKRLTVVSETAFAHVVTCSQGFNGKGSSGTATYAANKGSSMVLVARNGQWWNASNTGITYA